MTKASSALSHYYFVGDGQSARRVGKYVQYKAVSLKITINRKTGQKLTKSESMADNLTSTVRLDCLLTDKYYRYSGKLLASFPGCFLALANERGEPRNEASKLVCCALCTVFVRTPNQLFVAKLLV